MPNKIEANAESLIWKEWTVKFILVILLYSFSSKVCGQALILAFWYGYLLTLKVYYFTNMRCIDFKIDSLDSSLPVLFIYEVLTASILFANHQLELQPQSFLA
jgi:hypothetical protein